METFETVSQISNQSLRVSCSIWSDRTGEITIDGSAKFFEWIPHCMTVVHWSKLIRWPFNRGHEQQLQATSLRHWSGRRDGLNLGRRSSCLYIPCELKDSWIHESIDSWIHGSRIISRKQLPTFDDSHIGGFASNSRTLIEFKHVMIHKCCELCRLQINSSCDW
jgi:hypothetical protein